MPATQLFLLFLGLGLFQCLVLRNGGTGLLAARSISSRCSGVMGLPSFPSITRIVAILVFPLVFCEISHLFSKNVIDFA